MTLSRDRYIALRIRKKNLIRLEHYKRVCASSVLVKRLVLKCLLADDGVAEAPKALASQKYHQIKTWSRSTKHRTRC